MDQNKVKILQVLTIALCFLGVILMSFGTYLMCPAAGFIVGGFSCLGLGLGIQHALSDE